jgi:Magnesium chelatase, subunit ChlI
MGAKAVDITHISRVAGLTSDCTALVTTNPCRALHHTIADVAVLAGGQVPLLGEVSLAHHVSLFGPAAPHPPFMASNLLRTTLSGVGHLCGQWQEFIYTGEAIAPSRCPSPDNC